VSPPPQIGWYGDDLTGATDTLSALAAAGRKAVLFLDPPSAEETAPLGALDAIGIAGATRSMTRAAIADALAVIAGARGAAVVHCAAGKDRTGTVVALALDVAGVPHDVIADDYALTALRLPAIIERLMAHDFYGDTLATQRPSDQIPHAETMLAILADLGERHGGTRAWLRSRGWSGGDVEQLRARLVD